MGKKRAKKTTTINEIRRVATAIGGSKLGGRDPRRAAMTIMLSCLAVGPDLTQLCEFSGYDKTRSSKNSAKHILERMWATRILRRDGDRVTLHANDWEHPEMGAMGLLLDAMTITGELSRCGDNLEDYRYDIQTSTETPGPIARK